MKKKFGTREFVLVALLVAIVLLMSYTPLGYLQVGPLAITFNMIPVAIAAIALGPVGGVITGGTFGITSFLQTMGIGGSSPLGVVLFDINPFYTFVLCFVTRALTGFLLGYVYSLTARKLKTSVPCFITGFCAAFLNTLFFMSTLLILFGSTEYMQNLIDGRNVIVFVCAFVGINAVVEMAASTILSGAIGTALLKAGLIRRK